MPPRFHVADAPLQSDARVSLVQGAARHVQVLRCRVGDAVTLFDGSGSEWPATIRRIGRDDVELDTGAALAIDRELPARITLAIGMPANDRMDMFVEKATELGAAVIQPLLTERSVLRPDAERAPRKVAHWRAIAVAACEQCGRNRIPEIAPVRGLPAWLDTLDDAAPRLRHLLSLRDAAPLPRAAGDAIVLSGPEGGLGEAEEALARERGFVAVNLGARVLRADTAPLALLAHLGLR